MKKLFLSGVLTVIMALSFCIACTPAEKPDNSGNNPAEEQEEYWTVTAANIGTNVSLANCQKFLFFIDPNVAGSAKAGTEFTIKTAEFCKIVGEGDAQQQAIIFNAMVVVRQKGFHLDRHRYGKRLRDYHKLLHAFSEGSRRKRIINGIKMAVACIRNRPFEWLYGINAFPKGFCSSFRGF